VVNHEARVAEISVYLDGDLDAAACESIEQLARLADLTERGSAAGEMVHGARREW
jgi:hypothetical protein